MNSGEEQIKLNDFNLHVVDKGLNKRIYPGIQEKQDCYEHAVQPIGHYMKLFKVTMLLFEMQIDPFKFENSSLNPIPQVNTQLPCFNE